jgi:CrcB protein
MKDLLLVALSGATGSVLRYAVGLWLKSASGQAFPAATLLVNLVGSLLIGLLAGYAGRYHWVAGEGWILLATGLCGGFTTFSTFSLEGVRMLQAGATGPALFYLGISVVIGLALCALGYRLAV